MSVKENKTEEENVEVVEVVDLEPITIAEVTEETGAYTEDGGDSGQIWGT